MTTLEVGLAAERGYEIQIGSGTLAQAGSYIATVARSRRVVVVTQPPIERHWLAPLSESLSQAGLDSSVITYPAGERHKHLRAIARLYERLYNLPGIDRKTLLVALGGGVGRGYGRLCGGHLPAWIRLRTGANYTTCHGGLLGGWKNRSRFS
ncbi:MAG: hypothetical protein QM758_15245 [Armatimonas sp.]